MSKAGTALQLRQIEPGTLVSLSDAVAGSLRSAILSGEMKSGDRILQDRVAADLGVSRQPVRDALNRLEVEGLVTELTNGRVVVREYSTEDVCENYLLRRVLEREAVRIAASTMTDDEIDELAKVNEALRAATGGSEENTVLELNDRFHRLIRVCTKHRTLEGIIDSLWVGLTIATPLSIPGRAERSIKEHDRIVVALRARDPHAASQAMADHIDAACHEYLQSSGLSPSASLALHASDASSSTQDAATF
jgi:DNA-binding GntR family transcriptional regulator